MVRAHRDVEAILARALGDASGAPDLAALRTTLRRRIEGLRVALGASLPADQAMEALVPLVFLIDERVLERLADGRLGRGLGWILLQRDLFPGEDGGDVFFERADDLLRGEEAPGFLVEVYLFCLHAGFQGRHADDPEALARYKAQLAARVPVPPLPEPLPPPPELPRATSTRSLVLMTLGAILAFNAILFTVAASMW
jgi:type VI protein secretion system component VasF